MGLCGLGGPTRGTRPPRPGSPPLLCGTYVLGDTQPGRKLERFSEQGLGLGFVRLAPHYPWHHA